MRGSVKEAIQAQEVAIPVKGSVEIAGSLSLVDDAGSVIVMCYVSSSARRIKTNLYLAEELNRAGYSTILVDLLTADEQQMDLKTGEYRFDIDLLAERTKQTTEWISQNAATCHMDIAYFGENASAASALAAASELGHTIKAVVSQGGRCDLVEFELPMVKSPVLYIVGQNDNFVTGVTRKAAQLMRSRNKIVFIEGASHHFEEPGAINQVACHAKSWFAEVLN